VLVHIVLVALVASRLLGVHQSPAKALVSGAIGWTVGTIALWLLTGSAGGQRPPSAVLVFLPAVLATMGIAVALELLSGATPPHQEPRGSGGLVHPVRALRRRARRIRRYVAILRIAVRHGLGPYLGLGRPKDGQAERWFAPRLREALQEAGGVFVKLGQVLSTRTDLLPADFITELAQLQDGSHPHPCSRWSSSC